MRVGSHPRAAPAGDVRAREVPHVGVIIAVKGSAIRAELAVENLFALAQQVRGNREKGRHVGRGK